MRGKAFVLLFIGCGLLLAELPASAHHAFAAEFDAKQPIKLTGTVTKIEWQNPHTYFYIDAKDDSDKINNWGMEMGSPNLLIRAGWNRNSMKIGDVVTVEGFRAKNGSFVGNAQVVTLTNTGKRLFAASSSQGQPAR
ncbi:MAG TPA: DUF6152 family protein [Terriglobia bacterium]|nr:DUF6152 family protein [Terriglobia bacterium]